MLAQPSRFVDAEKKLKQQLLKLLEKQNDESIPAQIEDDQGNKFLFLISRLHREEDFQFIIKGITRLLNNPLQRFKIILGFLKT